MAGFFLRFYSFFTLSYSFFAGQKGHPTRRMAFVLFFFSPYNNKAKLFNLPEMLFSAGSGIDSGRIDAAVPQQTGQVFQILLALVETAGKQMPQLRGKTFRAETFAFLHRAFIIAQILLRFNGFPERVTKTLPCVIPRSLQ